VNRIGKLIAPVLFLGCGSAEREQTFFSRDALLDPETCNSCHPKHYQEWSGSMHAYASFDPVFRAMNARGQEETGGALGELCVNCHAPMAVREGATKDGLDLDSVPKHLQGITCYFCHNVDRVEGTHNNPLVLANDVTMRGGFADPAPNSVHDSAYSPLLDSDQREPSSSLCGSCHDIMMPKELSGAQQDVHLERTFEEWRESIFNDENGQPLSCGDCHLRTESRTPVANLPNLEDRLRRLHTFPGVDLALTEFPARDAQLAAVQDFLETSLRIEVCVSFSGGLRVVLESLAPGHNFPTGASQDRRIWVEVRGYDEAGAEQFAYGVPPAGTSVTEVSDAWILRDLAFKANGEPAHMFWDVARWEPGTILAPITRSVLEEGYDRELRRNHYRVPPGFTTARIAVLVRVQPIGLDVLDDLVQSGHLDRSIRNAMPTLDLLPNRATSSDGSSLTWTYDEATSAGYPDGNDYQCLESSSQIR
jgi:hypothetical protein